MVVVLKPFIGRWQINHMDKWSQDAVNLIGQAFIEFDNEGMGRFTFIAVTGFMDCEYSNRSGEDIVEFSWQGNDERDETNGRGWAKVDSVDQLTGHIFIHCGEDSGFVAASI